MTLNSLIDSANDGYPDGYLALYWNRKTQKVINKNHGDSLAKFIVAELQSTYIEDADNSTQILEAQTALRSAVSDIELVIEELGRVV